MSTLVTHLVPVIGLHTHASQSDHSWVTCTLGSSSREPLTLLSPSLCRASPRWK